MSPVVGRLAPTPSGYLHLGNALAFGAAWLSARGAGGRVLLRVEDIDRGRSREEIAGAQRDDLRWLGLDWDTETPAQSTRSYPLDGLGTYRCDCTRRDRKTRPCPHRAEGAVGGSVRFRSKRVPVLFVDRVHGVQIHTPSEDPLLVRADGEPGYPLAVVLDDHRDGVTEVVRGGDLLVPTAVQAELLRLLRLPEPTWLHTPVLYGEDGRKLGKSHGSTELRSLRAAGWSAARVWRTLLPLLGIEAESLLEAVFDSRAVPRVGFVVSDAGEILGSTDRLGGRGSQSVPRSTS